MRNVSIGNHSVIGAGSVVNKDIPEGVVAAGNPIRIINKLQKLLNCSFEILQQRAGIRPTVIDRRPLVGQHRVHKNLYILNGLGSRGVLMAPTVAKNLIDFIEKGLALPKDIDINRFTT
mgnify:CR=1 FL=1